MMVDANPYLKKCFNSEKYFVRDPEEYRGRWKEIFRGRGGLFLDAGCGGGVFTIEIAYRNPEYNFIGIDYTSKYLYKAIRKAELKKINNIKFACYNIINLDQIFGENELEGIYLLFSDPYKKKKQLKHRVISAGFISTLSRILKKYRYLVIKTDDSAYFGEIISLIEKDRNYNIVQKSQDYRNSKYYCGGIKTHYEEKFSFKEIKWVVAENVRQERK